MSKCEWHETGSVPCCGQAAPQPYPDVPTFRCSRPLGHGGACVACTGEGEDEDTCVAAFWCEMPGQVLLAVRVDREDVAPAKDGGTEGWANFEAMPAAARRRLN